MMRKEFIIRRNIFKDEYTLGRLLVNDTQHIGYVREETDRELEHGGFKVEGQSAIPRGRYPLTVTWSTRFNHNVPTIYDVCNFTAVHIHGESERTDAPGCILLGALQTSDGVTNCDAVNAALITSILDAELRGLRCWITIR